MLRADLSDRVVVVVTGKGSPDPSVRSTRAEGTAEEHSQEAGVLQWT